MKNVQDFFNWFSKPKPERPENSGLLGTDLPVGAYIVGDTSPIAYEERLSDGNWSKYMFDRRPQFCWHLGKYVDFMTCTNCSLASKISAQRKFLFNEERLISRRFFAIRSGNTQKGNYVFKPMDVARKEGWIYEDQWPEPKSCTWEEYHTMNAKEQLILGKMAKDNAAHCVNEKGEFGKYEFLALGDPSFDKHLKQAPLSAVIPGHSVAGFFSPEQYIEYRDSYEPWDKKLPSLAIIWAAKFIIEPASIKQRKIKFSDSPEVWHVIPNDSVQSMEKFDQQLPGAAEKINNKKYTIDKNIYTLPAKKPVWN